MAISIYDTQAELPPIDFNFLAGRADKAEAKKEKNWELLGKAAAGLPIQGGYATQNAAKEYNEKVINPLLDKYATKIANNEPMNLWYPQYIKDVGSISTDIVYNKIKRDEAAMPAVGKLISSPEHKYAAQYHDYYDPQKGFTQVNADQIMQGWTPEEWYKSEAPVTYFDDFKDEFAAAKSKITQLYGDPVESLVRDDKGNVIASIRTQEGVKKEVLNRDMIKSLFGPMFTGQNYQTLLGSKPSLRYNTLKADKYVRQRGLDMIADAGLSYTNDQALDDVVNHFLGSFETVTELTPKTSQTKLSTKSPKKGFGFGDSNEFVEGYPNEVSMTLNKLGKLDTEGNISGKTKVRPEVLTAMIGGREEEDGFVVPFDAANPAFLQVPKTVSGSGKDEDFSLARALPYKSSYENAKTNLLETMEDIAKNQVRSIKGVDAKGNQIGFSYLDDGTIGYKDAYAMQNPLSGWTSKITVDDFINNYLSNTELARDPNVMQLYNLAATAREQFGIDLSDPEIQKRIDKISSTEQGKMYQEVAQSLASLQGSYEFYTDNSTDNLFLDESGTPVAKGFIVLNEKELEQILPNYKEAVKEGIIVPYGFGKALGNKGNEITVTKYKIPIYRGTDADIDNTTQTYVDAAYGSTKDVNNLRREFIETSKNAKDNLAVKRGYQMFSNMINKDPMSVKGELMDATAQLSQIDNASASQANGEIMDLYNRYEDGKISKANLKKELYLLYLALQVKIEQQGDPTAVVPSLIQFSKAKESLK